MKKTTSDDALKSRIAAVEGDADKIFGASGGWDTNNSGSGVGSVLLDLAAVNGVTDSADRMPPAPASALYEQASTALASNLAAWDALKNGKLAELNRALRGKKLKEIDIRRRRVSDGNVGQALSPANSSSAIAPGRARLPLGTLRTSHRRHHRRAAPFARGPRENPHPPAGRQILYGGYRKLRRHYPRQPAAADDYVPLAGRRSVFANGLWHYIDIPVPTKAKTLDAFCPEGNCVTAKIKSFSETLRTSKDDAQRRQALLFLVHFVGDIHQPLHCAERSCDKGGNSERVNFLQMQKERNVALHHVWDSSELDLLMKHANITDDHVFAGMLMAAIKPAEAEKWAQASPDQMAWESYKLAVTKVYRGIPFQNFCENQKPAPMVTDLTPAYENEGTKVVREQLMKAGVRLAAILESDINQ